MIIIKSAQQRSRGANADPAAGLRPQYSALPSRPASLSRSSDGYRSATSQAAATVKAGDVTEEWSKFIVFLRSD